MLGSLLQNSFMDVFLFENSDPECLRAQREAEIRCREKTEERIRQREITMKSLSLAEYHEWMQMERANIESRQERERVRERDREIKIEMERERDRALTVAINESITRNDLVKLGTFSEIDIRRGCRGTGFGAFHMPISLSGRRCPPNTGLSPLHVAATLGRAEVVAVLLLAGVPFDLFCPRGQTPLFLAITNGHVEVVANLTEAGALVLLAYEDSRSGLHWAAASMHVDVCRYLIEHAGYNVAYRSEHGDTALDAILSQPEDGFLSRRRRSTQVMYLLRALAQCGGPVPRLPSVAPEMDLHEGVLTAEDREFTAFRRVRHWREAAALQRRMHVCQYPLTRADYDPDLKWESADVQLKRLLPLAAK